jgi:hypothetical protein
MKRARWWLLAVLALLALVGGFLLASKSPSSYLIVDSDQLEREQGAGARLEPGRPVGQTFVARHAGLAGIEFFLVPLDNLALTVTLHLRADPRSAEDLAMATVRLPAEAEPGYYRFSVPSLKTSHGQYYYAYLEGTGGATDGGASSGVSVALAKGAAYPDGAAYQAHQPLDAQTSFRLVYAPGDVVSDLLRMATGWPGLLFLVGLLFVVPGWALLSWFWPRGQLRWAETLGVAVGLSLALYPLLLVWTDLVGLHLGSLYAWLPAAAGLAALLWRYRSWRPRKGWERLQRWTRSEALWADLALVMTVGLVFAVRLLVVRTLRVPMWGDSYQHTMIAQLLVDNGGLFDSWEPYVPLKSFTYHFGFHAAVAVHHWLTGVEMTRSVIVTGQMVNALAVLSLYPVAVKVGGSRWTGVVAVLVAGLLSPMPLYYVNWGRYVQLAGQAILPTAIWLTWMMLESGGRRFRSALLTGLAVAGLILSHYRVAIYFIVFLPIAWAAATLVAYRRRLELGSPLVKVAAVSLVSFVLVLPWAWHLFAGLLPQILGTFATSQADAASFQQSQVLRDTTRYVPIPLLVSALIGLVLGLIRRRSQVLLLAVWVVLLFLAANPNWVGLPGAVTVSNFEGVLNNFTVLISLYMPVSILCGYLVSTLLEALPDRLPWPRQVVAVGLILILAVLGARRALTVLDLRFALVSVPDLQAMEWIEEHTPASARFLANFFFAYEENVIVGSDAGWWVPLLANRENTVPPITYGHESAHDPDYISKVNEFARYVEDNRLDEPETIQALKANGITHIYIGQKGGNLPVEVVLESDAYDLAYHKDRVWIFDVR